MANHFSQLAKKSRTNGNAEKIAKEQPGKPSLDIYKLGDDVLRPSTIKLKFRDEMGRPRKMKADGLLARCIQHEMDHLNGILFVDRVTSKDDLNKELLKEGFNEKDVISIN